MKKFNYSNKTIIVTGASSGIGKEISLLLTQKYGAKVIGVARTESKLNKLKSENFTPFKMDASKEEDWLLLKNYILTNGILIDGIINSAGILPKFSTFKSSDSLKEVFDVNFYSIVYSAERILPLITNGGIIINVCSSSALCPFSNVSAYSASKAAAQRFSECLSCEVKNLTVTTVLPGFTKTNILNSQLVDEKEKKIIDCFSNSANKVAKRILKKASKRKRRLITGFDAHFMNFLYKLAPNSAPKIISKFLTKSNFKIFKDGA